MRRHRTLAWIFVGCAGLITAAGCSGSTEGGSGSSAAPVPADQFISTFVNTICDNVGQCCQAAGYAYDANGCKTALNTELGAEFNPTMPNIKYDEQAAGNCIDAVKKALPGCVESDLPDCEAVIQGTLPAGATCTKSAECAEPAGGGAYCEKPDGATQGTCVQEPRGKLGDGCSSTCTEKGSSTMCEGGGGTGGTGGGTSGNASCYTNDGLYCEGTCKPVIPLDGACEYSGCVTGAYCAQGKCTALPGPGSSCAQSYECAPGAYCDETTTTCQAAKQDGQPCQYSGECASDSCNNGTCGPDTLANQLLCNGSKTK